MYQTDNIAFIFITKYYNVIVSFFFKELMNKLKPNVVFAINDISDGLQLMSLERLM